jgi:hypothetical protein
MQGNLLHLRLLERHLANTSAHSDWLEGILLPTSPACWK